MKNRRLLMVALCLSSAIFTANAQNKTLGVGITTPNPNAALHVESPTANQGFIMPRLTTAQRTSMSSLLTAADKGLMLYDTDLNTIYIWNGAAWKSTAGVATNGLDTLSHFKINNNLSLAYAVYAETNGDSLSAAVHGNNTGHGFGIFGKSAGAKFASAAVYGEHVGTGDAAGAFRVSNSANPNSALFGETFGTGPAIFASQQGLGRGGQFQITNATNTNAALRSFTSGTGNSGFFTISNPSSTVAGIYSTTNGTGAAFFGENTGSGNGFSGLFKNTNASNTFPAIQAGTAGTGTGVRVIQDPASAGGGIDVYLQNTSSAATGLSVDQRGTGTAATININNAASTATALFVSTNGTSGQAISALSSGTGRAGYFELNSATNTPAVTITSNGTGSSRTLEAFHTGVGDAIFASAKSGSAGNFQVTDTTNTASAVYVSTNAPGGTSLGVGHSAGGNALVLWSGGLRLSTATVSTSTITTRAAAYLISGGGVTFSFSGVTMNEGDTFYFYNNTASAITVNGVTVPANAGKTCIYLGGGLRGL